MSFYELQEGAIKQSRLLVLYFAASVLIIVLSIDAVVYFSQIAFRNWERPGAFAPVWGQLYWATGITLAIIAIGSLYRYIRLRSGGRALARLVGATRVDHDTEDQSVKRFINVVEEMSIASGIPVPALYVMEEEDGLNAFVAGYAPADTVLVATRGAIDKFDRDELQGVIAHEFSHIFHGDIKLNMDIMSLLAGIMLVSQLGAFMLRGLPKKEIPFVRSEPEMPLFVFPFLMVAGSVIWFIGAIGLVFGELIQAAVSRQREYLADSSAVQYTRNPDGIARALAKILRHYMGSRLWSLHAHELRHICFGETLRDIYEGMFSTHPPLDKRIKALNPQMYYKVKADELRMEEEQKKVQLKARTTWSEHALANGLVPLTSVELARLMSVPDAGHREFAAMLMAGMPGPLVTALHSPESAACAVYALLIPEEKAKADEAERVLRERVGYDVASYTVGLKSLIRPLGLKARLPILDLATPAISLMHPAEKERFITTAAHIIQADGGVSLFEYVLYTLIKSRFGGSNDARPARRVNDVAKTGTDAAVIVSAFAWAGTDDAGEAAASFDSAMRILGLKADAEPLTVDKAVRLMDRSLDSLDALAPKLKELLLTALADCIMRDNQVMVAEAELLRAVAGRLGCPMPPLVRHAV